jgi:hypothetical protein
MHSRIIILKRVLQGGRVGGAATGGIQLQVLGGSAMCHGR